jgi:hypothetical protein
VIAEAWRRTSTSLGATSGSLDKLGMTAARSNAYAPRNAATLREMLGA